ncbi:hypothetical protein GCM10007160_39800 [Litchfieldella qijiaojingensis]|uniref:Uncharacterized protein n=1 Tax=Litchfieldella qijiaojingensis TaxID=980347 RepID=A0ABQ2Z8L4_9GAMM|nr:hypothetical protein [Halomonas qijiaojingensis]GGY08498.1 hypothetical protein GCM10007160_39800 [Halomonas qijiaojingensis]
MKVVAKSNAESVAGWLETGKVFTVLAVSSVETEGSRFLIWSEKQESLALFPASDFEIKDAKLSRRWVASLDSNDFICLAPEKWQVDGFWEKYYDGDTVAEKIVEEEIRQMHSE